MCEIQIPSTIDLESTTIGIDCHPSKDIIAAGDIDGKLHLLNYFYKSEISQQSHSILSYKGHKKACRSLKFNSNGERLFSCSKDGSINCFDTLNGKSVTKIKEAHEDSIYSLFCVDDNILATGDDNGVLKIWDMRYEKCVMENKECDDFISDFGMGRNKRVLVMTCGEGTLTALDIRKHRLILQSELFDSELLSVAVVKKSSKVVCGSGDGVLNIFNWDEWGSISDRYPVHTESIDCIQSITEEIICVGSSDGKIRAVNIVPNRTLGVVGQHSDFPIESMSVTHCENILASCSHDQKIKFWDIQNVRRKKFNRHKKEKKETKSKPINSSETESKTFFSDLLPDDNSSENIDRRDESDENSTDIDSDDDTSDTSDSDDS